MTSSSTARLHWLVAAPIHDPPTNRTWDLLEALDQLVFTARIDIGPALGAAGALEVELGFSRLRSFSIAGVLAAETPLRGLVALSERLGGPASRRPVPSEVLDSVAKLAGEGPLWTELSAIFHPPAAPASPAVAPAPAADAAAASAELVDELLAQAPAPATANRPSAIIDAIVGSNKPAPAPRDTNAARAARDRLDVALADAARAVLDDPKVATREALWRSLKLLHEHSPRAPSPKVTVLDCDHAGLLTALDNFADDEPMDRPDLVVVAAPVHELDGLPGLAARAADLMVPVVVSLEPAALGRTQLSELVELAETPGAVDASWQAVRGDDNSRWLAAVVNPITLANDGRGAQQRTIFGAPALALAALLSASQRDTNGLASLARPGTVRSPSAWDPGVGRDAGTLVPTQRFASLTSQSRLASLGLISLGSPRGGDSVVVAACPTVYAGDDAVSLPAQVLTGRIVRFAVWATGQIPSGSTAVEIQSTLSEAAGAILFPDLSPEAASLRALVENDQVLIHASVHPAIAGARLDIEFALPLRVALG